MKIAMIGSAKIPSRSANSIQIMKMTQAYKKLGHEVTLYLPTTNDSATWKSLAQHYGLSTRFDIKYLPANRFLRGYDFALQTVRQVRRDGMQIIHTRHPQSAAWASDFGIPIIFELHDLPSGALGPRLLRLFHTGSGGRALVVITQALAKALKKKYRYLKNSELMQVHPDGIDIERYQNLPGPSAARQQLKLEDSFTVGYTGHLYEGRGIELILALAKALPAINFLLVGGRAVDIDRYRMKNAEEKLKNVNIVGFVANAELPLYQSASDILLMPYQAKVSASSGGDIASFLSPMKMFEYLGAARPILASDLAVFSEILDEQNAWRLPAQDLDAWISAIQRLETDSKLRKSYAEAAGKSAQAFTWEKRAEAILKDIRI